MMYLMFPGVVVFFAAAAAVEFLLQGLFQVVQVRGIMIENLHVDNARRVLAVADAIAALG